MANYTSVCRTNYFKVGRPEEFLLWVKTLPNVIWQEEHPDEHDLKGMLYVEDGDGGGWPNYRCTDEDDQPICHEDMEFDIFDELAEFLAPNEVAIFMEVGSEKIRYLHGQAIAVHSSGEVIDISLNDIYQRVNEAWPDSKPTECNY